MKFEKKVEIAKKRGYALINREEFAKLLIRAGDTIIHIPFGCVECGRAYGEKDFTEIFYVLHPEKYDWKEAQGLFGGEVEQLFMASLLSVNTAGIRRYFPSQKMSVDSDTKNNNEIQYNSRFPFPI